MAEVVEKILTLANHLAPPGFDYSQFDRQTELFLRDRAAQIHNLARLTATSIVQIGKHLTEVKERLDHGQFVKWIETEFAWTRRTAVRFMQVYENVKWDKLSHLINLDLDVSALYLIAAPRRPEPVRDEVFRRAGSGESVTHKAVRAAVQQFEETGELPDVNVSLSQVVRDRRRALREDEEEPTAPLTREQKRDWTEIKEQQRRSTEHLNKVYSIIRAIEALSRPALPMAEAAAEIRSRDTPAQNWEGQAQKAAETLNELLEELKQ